MTRAEVVARIDEIAIIPAVRVSSAERALFAAEAVHRSGIPIVEVTMTVPGALDVIARLTQSLPGMVVGAGTVLDADTARRCLDAGARFLTSPGLVLEVIEVAKARDTVVFPGALTPTEVIAAWKAGADFVKIYPCSQMGGHVYIRALKTPLPQVRLIASGGVNQQTAGNFILAGAAALGIGSELIPNEALHTHHEQQIRELARRYLKMIADARARLRWGANPPFE